MEIFEKLKAPFSTEIISWRVGATNKNKNGGKATKGIALAYIDARDVMQRLDEVVGSGNWQARYPHANGKTCCEIDIWINGRGWVTKSNGAGDSATEAEKGAFSDAFKRAAVLWGIGRYLYDVPNIWVDLDEWGHIKEPGDIRLQKALSQAASGLRGIPEPAEPESKPDPRQEKRDWIAVQEKAINAFSTIIGLDEWKKVNEKKISELSKEQQAYVDKIINSRMGFLAQAPTKTNGASA